MPIPIGNPPPSGGDPSDPGLTCAQAKANIASLTLTLANLTSLLARTTDPVQRADIQAGISQAQEELAVLRSELPLVCGPPPPPPVNPIPVLIVTDGIVSFAGTRDSADNVFTLSQFQKVLNATAQTNPVMPVALTFAHRRTDPGVTLSDGTHQAAPASVINEAYFTWRSSTPPAGVTGKNAVDLSAFQVVFLFGYESMSEIVAAFNVNNPNSGQTADQILHNLCLPGTETRGRTSSGRSSSS